MAIYIEHTIVDEVRLALNALSSSDSSSEALIKDEQIRRFIFPNAFPEAPFAFQKFTDGLWVNRSFTTRQYWNMQVDGIDSNIYRLNSTGSIEVPDSYSVALADGDISPVDQFILDGDFSQHFPTGVSFFVVGPPDVNGEVSTIANEGTYTVASDAVFAGGQTTIEVEEQIPSTDMEGGYIIFAPINTDNSEIKYVTACAVDFNDVMHDVLFCIATSHSREKLANLTGFIENPYENIISQARRYRGVWSI